MSKPWTDRVMPPLQVQRELGVALLPCPFCASENVGMWIVGTPHVTCGRCEADGPAIWGPRENLEERQREAALRWNVRPSLPQTES